MIKIYNIVLSELKIQNRIFKIIKLQFQYIIFALLSSTLINSRENLYTIHEYLSSIIITIIIVNSILSQSVIRNDFTDGTLEILKTKFEDNEIIIGKWIALYINISIGFILSTPITLLFCKIELLEVMIYIITTIILIGYVAANTILLGCIESYSKSGIGLLSFGIFIISIPESIICGMSLYDKDNMITHISILFGINLVIVPLILYFAVFLLRNIYNCLE